MRNSLKSTRFPFARRLIPIGGASGGQTALPARVRAINFSHVLHEPPEHPTIQAAVRSSARRLRCGREPEIIRDAAIAGPVDLWLAPSIGLFDRLPDLLEVETEQVILIDRGQQKLVSVEFFAAPANLTIPATGTIGIAAAIVRPGNRSIHLITRGPFNLPDNLSTAIRHMEHLIQSHAGQWRPTARIWSEGFCPYGLA